MIVWFYDVENGRCIFGSKGCGDGLFAFCRMVMMGLHDGIPVYFLQNGNGEHLEEQMLEDGILENGEQVGKYFPE